MLKKFIGGPVRKKSPRTRGLRFFLTPSATLSGHAFLPSLSLCGTDRDFSQRWGRSRFETGNRHHLPFSAFPLTIMAPLCQPYTAKANINSAGE
uniref:Uncharacterized protein n=1 Tax=uncultured bacterium contig00063 TaxID=1181546 RepID=A0A806KNV9_9BACT|nr:hypothetical protein [uncultured bacterium contig00063]